MHADLRTDLPADLPDAARAYLAALPAGRVVAFPIQALDRTQVPCWVVVLFPEDGSVLAGTAPNGFGYGATDGEAILGALGEIAEYVFPMIALAQRARVRASFAQLARARGPDAVADPLTLGLPAGSPVDAHTPLDWVEATRAATGQPVLVPVEIAASMPLELPAGYRPFTTPITNGLGAGPDVDYALGHGLLELLQRDGNGLVFRALDRGVRLDLPEAGMGAQTAALLASFEQAGIRIYPKFATDQFGLTNLYVVGHDLDGHAPAAPIMLSACGEACDPDRERALAKACREFAAARVRKTFSHGPLAAVASVAPAGYLRTFVERARGTLKADESRALAAMLDWARRDASWLRAQLADTVYSVRAHHDFSSLPHQPCADGHARGRLARERLQQAGFDILYLDCSPADRSIGVVKAIVPGLEVETMSYHRIGERNARRLIERDDPLVRFGAPTGTLRPVRLNAAALERLGGQVPLFDTALADRTVGALYPLYREPEAHHVAWRLDRANLA